MPEYTIAIALGVQDTARLWEAAAARARAIPAIVVEDIVDTIGTREDPDIGACLTMIVDPSALAGCIVHSFACTQAASGDARPPMHAVERSSRIGVRPMPLLHPISGSLSRWSATPR